MLKIASLMLGKQAGQVVGDLGELTQEIAADNFDVAAASNLLTLLSMLAAADLNQPMADKWVNRIALRFCSASGVSELMALAARCPHRWASR